MANDNLLKKKFIGVLLCGCIGDVLGSTNENLNFEEIRRRNKNLVRTFLNNKYTDDTEMTIVLAQYLINYFGTIPHQRVQIVHKMYQKTISTSKRGYSSRTRNILTAYHHCSIAGEADTNGAVMRIAPMALVPIVEDQKLYEYIQHVIYCTHGNSTDAIDTAFLHVKLLKGLISGRLNSAQKTHDYALEIAQRVKNTELYSLIKLLSFRKAVFSSDASRDGMLNSNITKKMFGFDFMQIQAIKCYICSLVCFLYNFDDPVNALIMAANIGGDTDTIAKIVGDLIGARMGTDWIPQEWKNPEGAELLEDLGTKLYEKYQN